MGEDLGEIEEILTAEMGGVSSSDVSPETPEKSSSQVSTDLPSRKKRKLFVEGERDDNDVSPHMSHIRDSERKVRDQFYLTVSALSGRGLSLNECCHAVVEVGNGLFNRKWKFPNQDNDTFDMDTLPALVNIRSKLRLIEAETLSLVVSSVTEAKESGRAITASIDSTTKTVCHTRSSDWTELPCSIATYGNLWRDNRGCGNAGGPCHGDPCCSPWSQSQGDLPAH